MMIRQWRGQPVDMIPGLSVEYQHPSSWPYSPDWLVDNLSLDTVNRCYWVSGRHRGTGESFFWSLYVEPLDWRYDLSAAAYAIGRHETDTEAQIRAAKERYA